MKWLHLIKLFPLGQVTSVHLLQQAHKRDRLSAPLEWIFKATLWVMEDSTNPTRLELVRDYVSSQLKQIKEKIAIIARQVSFYAIPDGGSL